MKDYVINQLYSVKEKRKGKRFTKMGWSRELCVRSLEDTVNVFQPAPRRRSAATWPSLLRGPPSRTHSISGTTRRGWETPVDSSPFIPRSCCPVIVHPSCWPGTGAIVSFYLKGLLLMCKSKTCVLKDHCLSRNSEHFPSVGLSRTGR